MKVHRLVAPALALAATSTMIAATAWAQAAVNANQTNHNYWNDWYFGWGWILWFGFIFLVFSSFGNWRYSYSAHQKYDGQPRKAALDIINERYARGEITREQYSQLKTDISAAKG